MTSTTEAARTLVASVLEAAGGITPVISSSTVTAPVLELVQAEAVADQFAKSIVAEVPAEKPEDFIEVHGTHVDLLENSVRIHLSNGTTKMITYADFSHTLRTFLDKATESREGSIRLLPSNVYMIEESIDRLTLCFYFPERIQNVNFNGDILPRIVPNIIMNVSLSRGSGTKKNDFTYIQALYYATNLPLARIPSGVVRRGGKGISILPFTNVYSEANLCTGYNTLIKDFPNNDLRQTSWFHDMLWASPFNYDLGVRALAHGGQDRKGIDEWYAQLANCASTGKGFPYDRLPQLN